MFRASRATVKIVLSYCAVSSLYVHPFSKCVLSAFTQGPLCLLTCFVFALVFTNCVATATLALFVVFHVIRKFSFNVIAMKKGALIVSVVPSSQQKRKLNCCKLAGGVTVSVNPVFNLFLRDKNTSCAAVFSCTLNSYMVKFVTT